MTCQSLLLWGVQGTACSALAGIYGALSVQSLEAKDITQQRIVMVGECRGLFSAAP